MSAVYCGHSTAVWQHSPLLLVRVPEQAGGVVDEHVVPKQLVLAQLHHGRGQLREAGLSAIQYSSRWRRE